MKPHATHETIIDRRTDPLPTWADTYSPVTVTGYDDGSVLLDHGRIFCDHTGHMNGTVYLSKSEIRDLFDALRAWGHDL